MRDVNSMEHVWSHVLRVSVLLLHLHGDHRCLPARVRLEAGNRLPFGASRLPLGCCSAAARSAAAAPNGRKRPRLPFRTAFRRRWKTCGRSAPPIRRSDISEGLNWKIDEHERIMIRAELGTGIFVNAASVIMRLGVATTILTGAGLILSGHIDFMILFLFLLVITRIYAPFDQSLALIAEIFVSQVSANRMLEIYDTPAAEGTETLPPRARHRIRARRFRLRPKGVLRDVSFTAKEGEITALVGPSGSGKSTCARLAARLWDVTRGAVKVGGVDISTVDPEVLLTDYSMVFQDVVLFDDTVMENIRLGKHGATDAEVLAAAKAANCDEFAQKSCPQATTRPSAKTAPSSPAASGSGSRSPGRS